MITTPVYTGTIHTGAIHTGARCSTKVRCALGLLKEIVFDLCQIFPASQKLLNTSKPLVRV